MLRKCPSYTIAPAGPSDIPRVIEVDKAAGTLFDPTGLLSEDALADHVPEEVLISAIRQDQLDVVRMEDGLTVGFTLVSHRGKGLYLDQISVDPAHGRKGIGRALMDHVIRKAVDNGFPEVTLSTFRDLAWNAPFYASIGFRPIPRKAMEDFMFDIEEAQKPFMDVSKRVFMRKRVRRTPFRVTRSA